MYIIFMYCPLKALLGVLKVSLCIDLVPFLMLFGIFRAELAFLLMTSWQTCFDFLLYVLTLHRWD